MTNDPQQSIMERLMALRAAANGQAPAPNPNAAPQSQLGLPQPSAQQGGMPHPAATPMRPQHQMDPNQKYASQRERDYNAAREGDPRARAEYEQIARKASAGPRQIDLPQPPQENTAQVDENILSGVDGPETMASSVVMHQAAKMIAPHLIEHFAPVVAKSIAHLAQRLGYAPKAAAEAGADAAQTVAKDATAATNTAATKATKPRKPKTTDAGTNIHGQTIAEDPAQPGWPKGTQKWAEPAAKPAAKAKPKVPAVVAKVKDKVRTAINDPSPKAGRGTRPVNDTADPNDTANYPMKADAAKPRPSKTVAVRKATPDKKGGTIWKTGGTTKEGKPSRFTATTRNDIPPVQKARYEKRMAEKASGQTYESPTEVKYKDTPKSATPVARTPRKTTARNTENVPPFGKQKLSASAQKGRVTETSREVKPTAAKPAAEQPPLNKYGDRGTANVTSPKKTRASKATSAAEPSASKVTKSKAEADADFGVKPKATAPARAPKKARIKDTKSTGQQLDEAFGAAPAKTKTTTTPKGVTTEVTAPKSAAEATPKKTKATASDATPQTAAERAKAKVKANAAAKAQAKADAKKAADEAQAKAKTEGTLPGSKPVSAPKKIESLGPKEFDDIRAYTSHFVRENYGRDKVMDVLSKAMSMNSTSTEGAKIRNGVSEFIAKNHGVQGLTKAEMVRVLQRVISGKQSYADPE